MGVCLIVYPIVQILPKADSEAAITTATIKRKHFAVDYLKLSRWQNRNERTRLHKRELQ